MFAGGVRHQEAIQQLYISEQPMETEQGNIMYNMLNGAAPTSKIVYGTDGLGNGDLPIPQILSQTIQSQGTTFPEMRYSAGGTGHYFGRNTILSGNYGGFGQGLRARPVFPTIFEYVRKHLGVKATKVWYLGNGISGSIPLLNYSDDPDYGSNYGANFFAPTVTWGDTGETHLENAKVYHQEDEIDPMREMLDFLNKNYLTTGTPLPDLMNTDEEKEHIKQFVKDMFAKKAAGQIAFPPIGSGGDLTVTGYACEVMKEFEPTLTVIDFSNVDGCHSNYSGFLGSLHRADHAIGHIWDYIQNNIPNMAGNTAMIVTPEHGRNLNPNPFLDENNWLAYDHDSDVNSRRVFAQMVGPSIPANMVVGSDTNPKGDSADPALTIAEILGFNIPGGYMHPNARSLFDRI
jgi:hypothetical protein